ncbi:hypothetical protein J4Q44_G00360690 [Coregonus suidteri]|uniref:Uncharacterized protein n=1 Tax=Coregonus suidteri TaxID=861788 RepID=A0AAN8KMN4_9TELE
MTPVLSQAHDYIIAGTCMTVGEMNYGPPHGPGHARPGKREVTPTGPASPECPGGGASSAGCSRCGHTEILLRPAGRHKQGDSVL